jgi:hypothetical protein
MPEAAPCLLVNTKTGRVRIKGKKMGVTGDVVVHMDRYIVVRFKAYWWAAKRHPEHWQARATMHVLRIYEHEMENDGVTLRLWCVLLFSYSLKREGHYGEVR